MVILSYSKDMISQFFELQPQGAFESMSFFLSLSSIVLLSSIVFLVILRMHSPEKDVKIFLGTIPMHLFYFALSGYFLVIFRLSKTPVLSARFMWLIWIGIAVWAVYRDLRKYQQVRKLAARKKANKEAGIEVVDPYLEAHYSKKKKKITTIKA